MQSPGSCLREPCPREAAELSREQGLDGRVGVGAVRENRMLRVRATEGARPPAPSGTLGQCVW